jgi:hypothetical protein
MRVKNSDAFIDNFISLRKTFKVRKSPNIIEIITSTGQKIYQNRNERFKEGLYLFNMVRRDVDSYINANGEITPYEELPVNYANTKFDYSKKIVGVDINNAYWTVAYLKGYITKKTYEKGLEQKDGMKSIRLSCLSTLGKSKLYSVYQEGEYIGEEQVKTDQNLQDIYKDIRYSTYGVMYEISEVLGKDFCCWRTDCIFFYDTPQNKKLVIDMIEDYGLTCKIDDKTEIKKGGVTPRS